MKQPTILQFDSVVCLKKNCGDFGIKILNMEKNSIGLVEFGMEN